MLIARGFVFFVVVVGSVALRPDAHKHAPLLAVITLFSISKMAFVATVAKGSIRTVRAKSSFG
jgi:hypothetical protein